MDSVGPRSHELDGCLDEHELGENFEDENGPILGMSEHVRRSTYSTRFSRGGTGMVRMSIGVY